MTRTFAPIVALVLLAGGVASAADQQVSADTYREGTKKPFYGRSDGLYWHKTYKSPRLIGNGDGYQTLEGPTYFEDFSVYADGQSAWCDAITLPGDLGFVAAASANQACDTTCGQAACVAGSDGSIIVGCADATADGCICQNTGLDLQGLCGADWEAPALGISLMSFPTGTRLANVALLEQLIGPDMDADGLDIAGDQTENDGVEVLGGLYGASGRPMWPNIDPAFEFCATVKINDLSGTDEFWVGWRDTTVPNATFNSYNSYAVLGLDGKAGDWKTETEDDGGGTTTTDVTLDTLVTDTATEICVKVSDAGAVSYTLDGTAPTNAVAYTFDAGEPIIPFLHFLHSDDVADEVVITEWRVSYQ